ncbi:MAG: tRNA adenosine(34) deaminase TadA [Planctomycetota bacterium]|jgi:tRNA(adenine34) deaminase
MRGLWQMILRMTGLRPGTKEHAGVTSTDLAMMRRAIQLATEAAGEGEVPVGAVVYRGETVIAEAANNREATKDPVGHAELLAMSEAGRRLEEWRLSDCSLAVTLEPCPMCAGAMVNARLGRVIYGARDPKAGACHTLYSIPTDRRLNHEVEVIGDVLADECSALLKDFFRARRRSNSAGRGA